MKPFEETDEFQGQDPFPPECSDHSVGTHHRYGSGVEFSTAADWIHSDWFSEWEALTNGRHHD